MSLDKSFDEVLRRYDARYISFEHVLMWCQKNGIDYFAKRPDPVDGILQWNTKGKPPAPGWWRASVSAKANSRSPSLVAQQQRESTETKARQEYRFWDGEYWSRASTNAHSHFDRRPLRQLMGRQDIDWASQRAPWDMLTH